MDRWGFTDVDTGGVVASEPDISLCPDSLERQLCALVQVGHGPQASLWVLERLRPHQLAYHQGFAGVGRSAELFGLAAKIVHLEIYTRMARAKFFLRALWRRTIGVVFRLR